MKRRIQKNLLPVILAQSTVNSARKCVNREEEPQNPKRKYVRVIIIIY